MHSISRSRAVRRTITAGSLGLLVAACGGPPTTPGNFGMTETPDNMPEVVQPTDDHGDTQGTATRIEPGSSTSGSLENAGDVDFFRIELASGGGLLSVETTGTTDTLGTLIEPDGTTREDDNSDAHNFRITTEIVDAGVYFVAVQGSCAGYYVEGCASGDYVLQVALTPDDHGDTQETATSVDINSSTPGLLHGSRDTDFFRFEVPVAGSYLTVRATGSPDTAGTLYLPDGSVLGNDDYSGGGYSGRSFAIFSEFAPAGVYFVRIRPSCKGDYCETGNYSLVVELSPDTPDDHGDTRETATDIRLPSATDGFVETPGDVDFFRLQLPSATGSLAIATTGDADTFSTLYLPDGTAWEGGDGRRRSDIVTGSVPAGVYFVGVRAACAGGGCAAGAYVLHVASVADDHGDTWETATRIDFDSATDGYLGTPEDVDIFRLDVPAPGGRLLIETTGITSIGGALYQRDGTGTYGVEGVVPFFGSQLSFDIGFLAPGTYLLHIRPFGGPVEGHLDGLGPYVLHVSALLPGPADDHGDTREAATDVPLDSSIEGVVGSGWDVDFFRLDVPSPGGFLSLELTTDRSIGAALHLANGATQAGIRSGLYTSLIVTGFLPAGTHFVDVRGRDCAESFVLTCQLGDSVGAYGLSVEFTADRSDDHADTREGATEVSLNSSTDGALEVAGDVDFFRLEVPASGGYLAIRSTGEPDAVGTLYLPDGTVRKGSGEDFSIFTSLLAGGTYYVSVEGACRFRCDTGPYALQALFSTDLAALREMLRP